MIAQFSSLCPMCGVYIAKRQSRISLLPAAIPVQPDSWEVRLRGGWYTGHGQVYDPDHDAKLRRAVHARCYSAGIEIVESMLPILHEEPVGPLHDCSCEKCGARFLDPDPDSSRCHRHRNLG